MRRREPPQEEFIAFFPKDSINDKIFIGYLMSDLSNKYPSGFHSVSLKDVAEVLDEGEYLKYMKSATEAETTKYSTLLELEREGYDLPIMDYMMEDREFYRLRISEGYICIKVNFIRKGSDIVGIGVGDRKREVIYPEPNHIVKYLEVLD
ncbi:MAG: hypothetical protein GPJ54_14660 [Candidatus Heimdallarchaeota archaeon]|nr:hypothetical protein [Candidatus Heimdallarchaeota archaeon]